MLAQKVLQIYQHQRPQVPQQLEEARFTGTRSPFFRFPLPKLLTGNYSLQDLGDLRQLTISYPGLRDTDAFFAIHLDGLLSDVVLEVRAWAQQYVEDGRYRDAEYLYRRANSLGNVQTEGLYCNLNEDICPDLVTIYERMGDYPAAEIAQEKLLRRLFAKRSEQITEEQILEVNTFSRLLSYFHNRTLNNQFDFANLVNVVITYRAASLDIVPLNEILFEQALITLEPNDDYSTSLHIATKENAINLVRLLIEKGADVNSKNVNSCTPLHIAAQYAKPAMLEVLLENNADVEVKDKYGRSPLHSALTGKSAEQTLALLINAKADLEARDGLGRTALIIAVQSDLSAVSRFLVQHGANVEVSVSFGETLLHTAVRTGKERATKLLLENGASLEARNVEGNTALYAAVAWGQEEITQILLDHGGRTKTAVDQQNGHQDTVLHCAIRAANVAIVEMLLKARAGIYGRDYNGNTALHRAVIEGQESHERILQLLLEFDAIRVNSVNFDGDTVLHLAVNHRRPSMISILNRHIEPDKLPAICQMRDNVGRTPLDVARGLADHTKKSSAEKSVLYLLENALELSHAFIKNIT